jgi:hypothetical protein
VEPSWEGGSPSTVSQRGHGMGGDAVGDVRQTEANGGACVRALASVQQPRGTGLGA